MTYKQQIFENGQQYRAIQTFAGGPESSFILGELLIFERDSYSPYDDSFVYTFTNLESGEEKSWWLADGQSKELWTDYFKPA